MIVDRRSALTIVELSQYVLEALRIVASLLLALFAAQTAFPQATVRGSVSGTVTDQTGAVVTGAQVTLTNVGTNIARQTNTGSTGVYVLPLVDPGFYNLKVEKKGFQRIFVEQFQVTTQANVPVDVSLKLGQRSEQVTVQAEAAVLNTREASVSSLVSQTELEQVPLSDKQYVNLVRIEPGVVPGNITTGSSAGRDFGNGGYINGKRFFDNTATVDGAAFWDPWAPIETISTLLGGPGVSHEAIAEFRVYANNPPPTEGFTYGGRVNVTTKTGSNSLHGSVYDFLRNDALDARSYFVTKKLPLKRNLFGSSIGGPIKKNKAFFYGDYEGMRQHARDPRVPEVPTPKLVAAIPGGPSHGYLQEIFQAVYPTPAPGTFGPNDLLVPFSTTADLGIDYDLFLIRVDTSAGAKNNLNFRYLFDQAKGAFGSVFSTGIPSADLGAANRWQQQVINWTRTVSPITVNEFRFNFHREFNNFPTRDTPATLVQCCGFAASMLDPRSLPTIIDAGSALAPAGAFPGAPQYRAENIFQINDLMTVIRGSHSLKFGVDVQTQGINDVFPQDVRPEVIFVGFGPPFDANTFGLTTGTFLSATATNPVNPPTLLRGMRRRQFAAYAQNTWRVRPRLTLDLGLRYEFVGTPYEVKSLLNNLYTIDANGNALPNSPITDITRVVLKRAGSCSGCLPLYHGDNLDFAPRIGLAWMPLGDEKTVFRAGYGIQYGEMFFNLISFNRGNPPFSAGVVLTGQPFGTNLSSRSSIAPPLYVYDPSLRRPYYMEWNAGVQRLLSSNTFLQVQYVGNRGRRLYRPYTPNFGASFTGIRPNPSFGRIVEWRSETNSWYDSLQTLLKRRFSNGLTFQVSYTWSKSLDEASGEVFEFGDNNFLSDPSNPHADKGPSDYDMTHVLVGTFVYQLPFGYGRKFLSSASGTKNAILGGWQVSGIASYNSGQRLTFVSGLDNNGDGNINDRARVVSGNFSLLYNRTNLPPTQFFNPAAIGPVLSPTTGAIISRNSARGPSFRNLDLALKSRSD